MTNMVYRSRRLHIVAATTVTILVSAATAHAVAAGTPDPTFGTAGKLISTVSTGGPPELYTGIALQSDGKMVVAGSIGTGSSMTFGVARYNVDGTLDPTFDGDGYAVTDLSFTYDQLLAMALQSDEKIVVTGVATVRYNSNGSLDTTFDGDGIATIPAGTAGRALALQSDGKIVIACATTPFTVARYNVDGSLDSSFDGDGVATVPGTGVANAVGLQSDGRIVVAGQLVGSLIFGTAVARLNTDGTLDTSFDGDGVVVENDGTKLFALTVQPDDKILVAGSGETEGDPRVSRYNTDGTLDTSFGGDGHSDATVDGHYNAVALQSDGKILAAGVCADYRFCVFRLNSDGSFDATFDGDGVIIETLFTGDEATAVVWQDNGKKIVVAGTGPQIDFSLARYLASCGDNTTDPAYETCDDGNAIDGDGCDSNCTFTACGNALVSPGELCDDGNAVDGDGCDSTCTLTVAVCGNGVISVGESCDDGNAVDGDGCSSTCTDTAAPESAADAQLIAGEVLTTDSESDGATPADPVETSIAMSVGTASATIAERSGEGPAPTGYAFFGQQVEITFNCPVAPCPSASQPLTITFRIDASRIPAGVDESTFALFRDGVVVPDCTGAPGVASPNPCVAARQLFGDGDIGASIYTSLASEWGFASTTCSPIPLTCGLAGGAKVVVKATPGNPNGAKLVWKWQKGTINSTADLGDPVTGTSYALCVYDDEMLVEDHVVAPGGTCAGAPCWQDVAGTGFSYKSTSGNDNGITKMLLKSGTGNAKILVKGKGAKLLVPAANPIFTQASRVTVQLVARGGKCWQAVYDKPAVKSTDRGFKDKTP